MRQPEPVESIHGVFEGPDEVTWWAYQHREHIAGLFCFVAFIDGWYILAEWNGDPETPPVAKARHTRGFWEFNGLESFEGLQRPRKSEA